MSGSKSSDGSFARAASLPPEARAEHPLGLTVHTLPEAGEAVATAQRARHGRWKMLGVLLICAAPVLASYFTYYVIRPEGRRVYGELINPQRTVPALTASTLDGGATRLEIRGAVLGEPDLAGPDLADDIAVTVDAIEDGRGAEAFAAFIARWLPEEREAA